MQKAGRCTSSQQIRCCGEYIVECERIGRLCIDRDHFDPVGRIDLPDQQYGHDGYHGQKRRNRDHEVYRSQGLVVRSPFVIEGLIMGLFGAVIPLALLYVLYGKAVGFILERFSILNNIITFSR